MKPSIQTNRLENDEAMHVVDNCFGISMIFRYDGNHLVEIINGDYSLKLSYDNEKICVNSSRGYTATYIKNSDNRIIELEDSSTYSAKYKYDSQGNLTHFEDSLQHNIELSKEIGSEKNQCGVNIKYTDNGKIVIIKNLNAIKILKYNKDGVLVYFKNSLGVDKHYNDKGILIHSKYKNIERWYYDNGQLKTVRKSDGSIIKYSTTGDVIFSK